jgi:hypothetical protein
VTVGARFRYTAYAGRFPMAHGSTAREAVDRSVAFGTRPTSVVLRRRAYPFTTLRVRIVGVDKRGNCQRGAVES